MEIKSESAVISSFEQSVVDGLSFCGIPTTKVQSNKIILENNNSTKSKPIKLGVAVSGGADSIALLTALVRLSKNSKSTIYNSNISVITVNHNIRPEVETAGDAEFVVSYCAHLGVPCKVFVLNRGDVERSACERNGGIEEAARFLRYNCFDEFIQKNNIDFLCLAHNRNDMVETILQRFFQGAGSSSLSGIPRVRGKYCRPLLNISRTEIENYLTNLKVTWRTDATNNDTSYLRNKYRKILMPVLDDLIPGWDGAVLSCAQKASDDDEVLSAITDKIDWECNNICKHNNCLQSSEYIHNNECVRLPVAVFNAQHKAIKMRLLYKALDLVGSSGRVTYSMLNEICLGSSRVSGSGVEITSDSKWIVVKTAFPYRKTIRFFVIIEEAGTYQLPLGYLSVEKSEDLLTSDSNRFFCVIQDSRIGPFNLPVCIRSMSSADEVLASDGNMKDVKKLFTDWHVTDSDKDSIPIIESFDGHILAVWGSPCGYPDWYVK